jgi:hypothetical protein
LRLRGDLAVVGPLLNLLQFVYQEDTLALGSAVWLHDPGGVGVLFKLFNENSVIAWQDIGHWNNVHIEQVSVLVSLSNWVIVFFHVFAETLDILYHQVFSGEFQMVRKVVEYSITDKLPEDRTYCISPMR